MPSRKNSLSLFEYTPDEFKQTVREFNELHYNVTLLREHVGEHEFKILYDIVVRMAELINEQLLLRGKEGLQVYEQFGKVTGLLKKPDQINTECEEIYGELMERVNGK